MQAQLIDTRENTKILYVFVKEFEYLSSIEKEMSMGHPRSGSVYRAVYNTDTKTYRIMYPLNGTFHGVFVSNLVNDKESSGYVCEIYELDLKTIVDFNISEGDLNELMRWLETGDADLKKHLDDFFKSQNKPVIPKISPALTAEIAAIVTMFNELREEDNHTYTAIGLLVTNLLMMEDEPETPIDNHWLRFDNTLGVGANLSSALNKLAAYTSYDRRSNFNQKDLVDAIRDLLLELYRINFIRK